MTNVKKIEFELDRNDYSAFVVKAGALGMTPSEFLTQLIADWNEVIEDYLTSFKSSEPNFIQHICRQLDTNELDKVEEMIKAMDLVIDDEKELTEIKGFVEALDSDYSQMDIDDAQECLEGDQNYYNYFRDVYDIEDFCQKNKLNEQSEMEKLRKWYHAVYQFSILENNKG
jgi:hypothetical protein